MRRKVARIGPSTLMISLPSKWVKANQIKKGDEVEVREEGGNLTLVVHEKKPPISQAKVDISHLSYRMVWIVLQSVYRGGADEIEISFKNQKIIDINTNKEIKVIDLIQQIADKLIGMVIIKQGRNYCLLNEVSNPRMEEFDNVLKRIFLSVIIMAEDSYSAIKDNDKTTLANMVIMDRNINKLSDFCMRTLNKSNQVMTEKNITYFIISGLETIGDYYKDTAVRLSKEKDMIIDKVTLKLHKETLELFRLFHELYYKFKMERITIIHDKRQKIKNMIRQISLKKKQSAEVELLNNLLHITNLIIDLASAKISFLTHYNSRQSTFPSII